MPSQGPNTTAAWITDGSGFSAWIIPANAEFSDDLYATTTLLLLDDFSDQLTGTAWGFAIPASATISGFQVAVEAKSTGTLADLGVRLFKAGPVFSDNRATFTDLPAVDTVRLYGGVSDKWGLTWSPAEVNAGGFGVAYGVFCSGVAGTASVDQITITVFFTVGQVQWMMMGVGAPQ